MRTTAIRLGLSVTLACASVSAWSMTADQSAPAAVQGASADNTANNARDKGDAAATPQHQSNAAGDRQLLAAVRRSVVHDKSLSTSAHNVKIMVAAGAVTLRGPVKSDDEKAKVETLAKQVDGVTGVDNQLDVKTN